MRQSRRPLATVTRSAALAALTLFLLPSSDASAQGFGDSKPLQGKNAFSLERFEESLFDERAQKIQAKMSKIRKKKIRTLEAIVGSNRPYKNKDDVLFRLAEAHWQEAKYTYLLAREDYDKAYDCFEEKRCTEEPKEPKENFEVSLTLYRQILREHPTYRRIDEVLYYLGRAALKAGKARKDIQLQKEAVKRLNDLVQKHPRSRFIAQSHLALGEYFFETDSLFYAKQNYEKIINNFKSSPMYNYALYKLGWVYFNLAEFEKAVTTFKTVIASIGGGKSRGIIEFRSQALNDLIVAYAEIEGGWRLARDYFLKEVGEKDTYVKLEKMAGLLVSQDKDEEAIDLYNHLIAHDKTSFKVVEYFDALLEVNRKLEDMTTIEAVINEFVVFLDPKGAWYAKNRGDAALVKRANDLRSTNLFFLANYYHRDAQKLDKERKPAVASYGSAANYYKMFIDRFPAHDKAYVVNFYYAEILYDQLDEYEKAAVQYEAVLEKDLRGEFVEDAALGVIYAVERMLVKEGLRENVSEGVKYEAKKKEADLRGNELKPIPRTDLHPLEQRYVNAADKYVNVLSEALRDPAFRKKYPKRGKMIPTIMFIAAQTFYGHGQFAEAVNRLMVIFDLYPEDKMANVAVTTIIDAYARLKHWDKIESWARKLIAARNFKVKKKGELEQMIAIAKAEHARDLTKQRKYDQAVQIQEEIVEEFGRKNKEIASKALYNVAVIHEIARRFPEAVAAYEATIKRYPKTDVAVEAQFAIGALYESQTEFAKAAETFIKMQKFKTHDEAEDAIRNAGLIYEALEQYRKAHDTFVLYLKLFKDAEDAAIVAFHSGEVLEKEALAAIGNASLPTTAGCNSCTCMNDAGIDEAGITACSKAFTDAAKVYTKVGKKHGKKDKQYAMRALAAAGVAMKKANKVKNRKKVTKLLSQALKAYEKLQPKVASKKPVPTVKIEDSTKVYAALAALELAEYLYDDYNKMQIKALSKRGKFDVRLLKKTLVAKAEALGDAEKGFDSVLAFQEPGMAAAAAFRLGQLLYEFAESLFNAPVPPEMLDNEELVDEYRYQLEEVAAPIQEKALKAFTLALKQALDKGVYNNWSRRSAEYAAKVNQEEFPLSTFGVTPDKTKDTLRSTSFISIVRRGDVVVDFND